MTNSNDNLVLHLKLDEIIKEGDKKKLIDVSSKKNNGTLEGNPQIVADEKFGSCLSFNGNEDSVVLPTASIPQGNEITVSFWAYGGSSLPKNNFIIFAETDTNGFRVLYVHLPWSDSTTYFFCGGNNCDMARKVAQESDFKGRWTHWAFTKNAAIGEMNIYIDGSLWHSETNKNQPILAVAKAKLGVGYDGKIANVRIYDKALSLERINQDMDDYRTAIASFNKTHPLDFNLYEGENKEPVIFIENGTKGQELTLEIVNNSGQSIDLPQKSGEVTATNYHFELRFRPETLSPDSLKQLVLAESQDWSMSPSVTQANGIVSLYFLKANNKFLNANETISLNLQHINGAVAGGARTTRVELIFPQFIYQEKTFNNYYREKSLSIVSHRGKKNIPLHVGFVGSNRILNDGTANTLTLRITNTLKDKVIPLNPGSKGNESSTLKIYFDVDSAWALGEKSQVQDINITRGDWNIKREDEGASPIWPITHQNEETGLDPGQAIELTISNIISSLPSGNANLYLRYENIPGYWDGTFICTIEKSPIVYGNNDNVGVGIGTLPGTEKLKVKGDVAIAGPLSVIGTSTLNGNTTITGTLNITSSNGSNFANPNNYMAPGSLTIGGMDRSYGGSNGWNLNTAGLLLETQDHTEIAVHDAGNRVASLMYYEGGASNKLTIGRDMGWGAISTVAIAGTITANALQIGNIVIGEHELRILKALAAGSLQVDLLNVARNEYLYAPNDSFLHDDDRRNVFTWRPKNRINSGQWNLQFPNPG